MLKSFVKRIPILRGIARAVLGANAARRRRSFDSVDYWERRYKAGGNSGAGSYNRLARFKADIINDFVKRNQIASVLEFGCGDGAQLALADYPDYVGVDVSPTVLDIARRRFAQDNSKKFFLAQDAGELTAELSMSLDVIYHLVEDSVFQTYMRRLTDSAQKYLIVYSSDSDERSDAIHVRHRRFTQWIEENSPAFKLLEIIRNRYPFDPGASDTTSFADFFIFERNAP
jgi:SAM-dependent methyltransferase